MPREDSTHREVLHCNRYTPAVCSKAPTAKDKKRIVCPKCEKTFSRKTDLDRHMVLHDPNASKSYKCTIAGCSYASHQKSNLLVHMKRHANTRDQYCTWPLPDGVCPFRCTDPSSLNRHIKRHVAQALKRNEPIPEEFLKYRLRLVAKLEADPEDSQTSESAEDSQTSEDAEETRIFDSASSGASASLRAPKVNFDFDFDFDPDLLFPQVNHPSDPATKVANLVNHGMPSSTSMPGPSSAGPCYFAEKPWMQPQNPGQQHYYGHPLLDCLPEEYLVNWPPPGQPQPQPPFGPPVGSMLDLKDPYALGLSYAHTEQLQPHPLSIEEIEGVAFKDLGHDRILPQTFFQPRSVQLPTQSTPVSDFCLFPFAENSFWF